MREINALLSLGLLFLKSRERLPQVPEATGRPTKYKPEYCSMLIQHMAQGLSFESFAAIVDTHRDTVYEWVKAHSEFSDAKKVGTSKCMLTWERIGMQGTMGDLERFNTGAWVFNMKNRFKWSDKIEFKENDDQFDERRELSKLSMKELLVMVKKYLPEEKNEEQAV